MRCDFCSIELPDNHRVFKADTFVHKEIEDTQLVSAGDWSACDICAGMVDDSAWPLLARRSVDMFFRNNPEFVGKVTRASVWEQITELHKQFREARHAKDTQKV